MDQIPHVRGLGWLLFSAMPTKKLQRQDKEKSYEVGSSHSTPAENAAICNIFQTEAAGEDSKLINMLEEADFHDKSLGGILLTCQELKEEKKPKT